MSMIRVLLVGLGFGLGNANNKCLHLKTKVLLVGLRFGLGNANHICLHLKTKVLLISLGTILWIFFCQLHASIAYGY